jgi:transcriptional regulator with GAF, ATPase, and Fis domain
MSRTNPKADDSADVEVLETTLAALWERHRREEHELLERALRAHGFSLRRAAAALDCPWSSLARALKRHPDLEAARKRRGPAPGHPKSAA